jgi:AcrR family transcriptional regulator
LSFNLIYENKLRGSLGNMRKDALQTRERLLDSASTIFAEKGFRAATIKEISEKAGANIAAVNYHFGSKEQLYVEAWRYAFNNSIKAHPPDGGISLDAPAEERLKGQIKALIYRISDPHNREFKIMQQELYDNTGLLERVFRELLEPLRMRTLQLVVEILGPSVPQQLAEYCEVSIISQCITPLLSEKWSRQGRTQAGSQRKRVFNIHKYAQHVAEFSLAGLKAVRMHYEETEYIFPAKSE